MLPCTILDRTVLGILPIQEVRCKYRNRPCKYALNMHHSFDPMSLGP